MELTPNQARLQATLRHERQQIAIQSGVSEGQAAAWSLSPSIQGFFDSLQQHVNVDGEELAIDSAAVRSTWPAGDADSFLLELTMRELVEERPPDGLFISALGRQALEHLYE